MSEMRTYLRIVVFFHRRDLAFPGKLINSTRSVWSQESVCQFQNARIASSDRRHLKNFYRSICWEQISGGPNALQSGGLQTRSSPQNSPVLANNITLAKYICRTTPWMITRLIFNSNPHSRVFIGLLFIACFTQSVCPLASTKEIPVNRVECMVG